MTEQYTYFEVLYSFHFTRYHYTIFVEYTFHCILYCLPLHHHLIVSCITEIFGFVYIHWRTKRNTKLCLEMWHKYINRSCIWEVTTCYYHFNCEQALYARWCHPVYKDARRGYSRNLKRPLLLPFENNFNKKLDVAIGYIHLARPGKKILHSLQAKPNFHPTWQDIPAFLINFYI